jgi:hypothetical protein
MLPVLPVLLASFAPIDPNRLAQLTGLPVEALVGLIACLAGAALMYLLALLMPVGRRRRG